MSTLLISAAGYRIASGSINGFWTVTSPSGAVYQVDPASGSCSCPDSRARGHRRACKHLRACWSLLELVPALKAGCNPDAAEEMECSRL